MDLWMPYLSKGMAHPVGFNSCMGRGRDDLQGAATALVSDRAGGSAAFGRGFDDVVNLCMGDAAWLRCDACSEAITWGNPV
jgi:hypothetical protein